METLDDRLLADFMHGFYGYGCDSADFWFVGMEEGEAEEFTAGMRR